MHACVRCLLRPQPTYRRRARARPGSAGGDAPRPSPGSAVGPAPPLRPTDGGVRAKPNSQCVASHVVVSAACGAPPLAVNGDVVRSRPTRCRPTAATDCAQCDAQTMPRVRRRTPKTAVCACTAAPVRGAAWRRPGGGRRAAAAPPPPPRRTRRACCNLVPIGEAFACADSGRFGARPVRRRCRRHSVTRSRP